MEVAYRAFEIGGRKVRPQALGEMDLGVSAFPQQKIAQSLLTAGTDQEIHIRNRCAVEVTFAKEPCERFRDASLLGGMLRAARTIASRAE